MRHLVVIRVANWLILLVVSWTCRNRSLLPLVLLILFNWVKSPRLIMILTLICYRIEVRCSFIRNWWPFYLAMLAVILDWRSWPRFGSQGLSVLRRYHAALRSHSFNEFPYLYRIRWRSLRWFKRGVHRGTYSYQVLSQRRPLPWRNTPLVIHGFLLHFKSLPFMFLAYSRLISAVPPCESLFHLLCCRSHLCKLVLFEGDLSPQFLLAL